MRKKKELLEYMEGEKWTITYVVAEMLIDIRDILIKIERR